MLDRELVVQVTPLPPSDKPTLFSKIQQDSRNPTRLGEERAAFGLGPGWAQTPVVSSLPRAAWKPGTGPSILQAKDRQCWLRFASSGMQPVAIG
jgi:hypothetical protein